MTSTDKSKPVDRPTPRRQTRGAEARGAASWRRRARRAVIALGAAAMIALVAVVVTSGGGGGAGVTKPSAFDLPALGGPGRVQLASFRGEPVVVNMFASWCTVCRGELPGFAKVAADLKGKVRFVGVNSQETGDGLAMAKEFALADNGFVLASDVDGVHRSGLHDGVGAIGMPVTLFYDRDGKLIAKILQGEPEAALRAAITQLYGIGA